MQNPQTVTVSRPAWTTEGNARVADWDAATTHDVVAMFAPASAGPAGSSAEVTTGGRQGWRQGGALYCALDADIEPQDRVTVDGRLYEVDSHLERWESPYGSLAGAVAQLRRIDG